MDSIAASPHDTADAPHDSGIQSAPQSPVRPQSDSQLRPQPAPSVVDPHREAEAQTQAQAQVQAQVQAQARARPQASTRTAALDDPGSAAHASSSPSSPAKEPQHPGGSGNASLPIGQDPDELHPKPTAASLATTVEQQDILGSPRHELELIPEDLPISSPRPVTSAVASPLATSSVLTGTGSTRASATSTPDTAIIRPSVLRPSRPSSRSPTCANFPTDAPPSPAIIRTASTHSVLRHPVPDINARSGSYTSNIAALEATAERFSMTSSIEDAIRDAHNELKRSDSRRSSILAASVRSGGDHSIDGAQGLSQSSIVGLNNAARTGGYSPGGYIMSPTQSLTGVTGRLRSGSKSSGALSRANSIRSKPETLDGEAFPNLSPGSFMSREGPGKGSTRSMRSVRSFHSTHSAQSNRSGPLSLAEIAEMEPPAALTLQAMDEADRTPPKLEDLGDDKHTILSRAHQDVEPDATDVQVAEEPAHESRNDWDRTPMLGQTADSYWDNHDDTNIQLRHPASAPPARVRSEYEPPVDQQHGATGTPDTVDEDNVFADFDGMHCDPDTVAEHFPVQQQEQDEYPAPQPRQQRPDREPDARPQSYFDPETNQQMLYYPARVPAMLNLPPKLSKGMKAAKVARAARRSQVLSQMPKTARESRFWLPNPLEDEPPTTNFLGDDLLAPSQKNFMGEEVTPNSAHSSSRGFGPEHALAALEGPGKVSQENPPLDPPELQHPRSPAKLGGSDARESRMNLSELPPQLRASVFFDMPSEAPKIEVKNGSAMDTLDSILDAAASAPVNAFTDHAFAGHLGSEVYGHDKKKLRKSQLIAGEAAGHGKSRSVSTTLAVPENEKRRSVWSLLRGKSRSSVNLLSTKEEDARSRPSGSARDGDDSASDVDENSALAPGDEGASDSGSEEGQLYSGPPTTLLAELQLRKRQHKNRTRNPLHEGNGLHSTLLELDAVAQMEAKQRQKKKINLAWAADHSDEEVDDEDDEDVPLGLLAMKKQLGPEATDRDMAVAAQELNRPLGLMEKRDQDDNEPLSRRRDRLQGKPVPVSMYLQPSGNATRLSVMHGTNRMPISTLRAVQPSSPAPTTPSQNDAEDEVEGETLGERMRRLRGEDENNPLPRTRPISRAFSEELLGEFGYDEEAEKKEKEEEEAKKAKAAAAAAAPAAEEEETLGQRRRRLQADREAREKEMGIRAVSDGQESVSRRLNMAGILSANPLERPEGRIDPREAERLRMEEEAARAAREQEAKMRAFRLQVPQSLKDPHGGVSRPGAFQAGRFNDNAGGLAGPTQSMNRSQLRASVSMGQLGHYNHGRAVSSTNLIGAAGNYGNPNVGPDGMNPVFVKPNPFGNGYQGGFLQQPQYQQASPFVSGSLLSQGGYGAFGGGIGAAGGYGANQTVYGAGVGFAGGMHPGYGVQAGGMPVMGGAGQTDRVENWRQSIR